MMFCGFCNSYDTEEIASVQKHPFLKIHSYRCRHCGKEFFNYEEPLNAIDFRLYDYTLRLGERSDRQ